MSWWIERPREGEIRSVHVDPMSVLLALGLIVSLYGPRLLSGPATVTRDGVAMLAIGFSCLVLSKISIFRRGVCAFCRRL